MIHIACKPQLQHVRDHSERVVMRHVRNMIITLLATALATTALAIPSVAAPTPRVGAVTLTVGTFNVNNGDSGLGNGAARMDRITGEIHRAGFDVVGIQEASTAMREQLAPRLSSTYAHSLLGDSKGRNATGGQIFYRTSTLYAGQFQGTIQLPTLSGKPRYGLYQDFYHRSTGARFLFVSTHLSNLDGRAASDARSRQAQELINRLAAINTEGLPLIVAGDMNSNHAKKYGYDAPRRVFQSSGLSEVFDRTATKKVNANFNSFNRLQRVPAYGGYRPDQVYVSESIGVQYAETMVEVVKKKVKVRKQGKVVTKTVKRYKTPFISDHNPIRSIVTVPG